MSIPLSLPRFKEFDTNGDFLAGGKLYSYHPGTTTAMSTFSDPAFTIANTNPVILNELGEAVVYLSAVTKLVLKDINDNTMWTMDNVSSTGTIEGFFNIRDYGAVGDDTTDDTTAIQAAITAATASGGKVFIPPGTYKTTTALTANQFTVMEGCGPESIIHQTSVGTVGIVNAHDTLLQNFVLQGPGGAYNLSSIGIDGAYTAGPPWSEPITESEWFGLRSVIQNMTIKNWGGNGISAVSYSKILNNTITDCLNEGIIANGHDCIISGNRISGTYSFGIDCNGSRNIVTDNILNNVGNMTSLGSEDCGGIVANGNSWSTGTKDVHIRGNVINGSTNQGIFVTAPAFRPDGTTPNDYVFQTVIVADNTIRNVNTTATGTPGAISVQDSTTTGGRLANIDLDSNVIDTTTVGYGIRAWGLSGGTSITNNKLDNIASNGIDVFDGGLHAPENYTIEDNTINNLAASGVANIFGINLQGLTQFTCGSNIISGNASQVGFGIGCTGATGYGIVQNNVIDTCLVGIYDTATGDYINFVDNNLANNNLTKGIFSGTVTNTTIRGNNGYVSENSGTSVGLSSGQTIGHGLAGTPTYISLTVASATVAPTNIIATVNSTVITVTFAGGGVVAFYWSARLAQSK